MVHDIESTKQYDIVTKSNEQNGVRRRSFVGVRRLVPIGCFCINFMTSLFASFSTTSAASFVTNRNLDSWSINRSKVINSVIADEVVERQPQSGNVRKSRHPEAIYVHIPFCRRRCFYCDFSIVPVGDVYAQGNQAADGFDNMAKNYAKAVIKEIEVLKWHKQLDTIESSATQPLRSIYFGGGTPSVAPTHVLRDILEAIKKTFDISPDAEISIEMDPGTFTRSKLHDIVFMGFNRVSLGVQSFDDQLLESAGRAHRKSDIFDAVRMLQEEGIDNFSIDLISGLPGLNLAKWTETLQAAVSLNPSHISCYDLQVEESTPFHKWFGSTNEIDEDESIAPKISTRKNLGMLPSADDSAFMYKYASGYFRSKGFTHYEISSYGKPGYYSRHNTLYWEVGSNWYGKFM